MRIANLCDLIYTAILRGLLGKSPDYEAYRDEFEAAHKHMKLERSNDGEYVDKATQATWMKWAEEEASIAMQW